MLDMPRPRATNSSVRAFAPQPVLKAFKCLDATTWSAEGMSEAIAAVVRTGLGAAMGAMAGMSRQQRFGPRSTHGLNIGVQRRLLRSPRPKQDPAVLRP